MIHLTDKFLNKMVNMVTSYIKDDVAANKLLGKRQFSPGQVRLAIQIGFDRMDNTPPMLSWLKAERYPLHLILKASAVQLLETAKIVDVRNSLPYQDSGLTVKDTHEELYRALLNYFNSFMQELANWKMSVNIEGSLEPMRGV